MNTQTTRNALLLLTAGSAALLAGCGGGGSNGSSGGGTTGTTGTGTGGNGTGGTGTGTIGTSQVIGKVTDVNGKGIPGVSVTVDSGGQITSTISTGGYRLNNLSAGVHKISVSATVNNVLYTGSTQVFASPASLTSNANVLLSAFNQQATVQGTVRDASGNPLIGASVYLAVPNAAIGGSSGNYSSLTAFTDSKGVYQINNIPSSLPTGSLVMTASTVTNTTAYQNQNATLPQNSITPGSVTTQNFTLAVSTNQNSAADVPVVVGINSFTQPTDNLIGSALRAKIATGSVYETLRRQLSPAYAGFAGRKRSLGKHLASRAISGSYAIETDIAFNPPAATDTNLLEYYVYRTTGSVTASPPTEATSDFYDLLADPLANYYTDLTASSDPVSGSGFPPYVGSTSYNFALSSVAPASVGGTTTTIESALSAPFTITPLGPLTLNAPIANSSVVSPLTVSWTPVAGATKYYVFVYTQYPGADSTPIYSSPTPLPAGTASTTVTLTGGNVPYYVVVVGTADETETAAATTPVVNAAQTYSEITKFVVQ